MTDDKQATSDRGQQAQIILDNPVFAEAFDGLRTACFNKIAALEVNDAAALQYQAQNLKIIEAVRAQFVSFIMAGTQAAVELAAERERLEFAQADLARRENTLQARALRQVQRLRAA